MNAFFFPVLQDKDVIDVLDDKDAKNCTSVVAMCLYKSPCQTGGEGGGTDQKERVNMP